jgi:hypothetical protein
MPQQEETTNKKETSQDLWRALRARRKERENQGDSEGYLKGCRLEYQFEEAYEKATGDHDEKLINLSQHLPSDWEQKVRSFISEK